MDNLVSLNVSYNNLSGYLPDNKLFRQLSPMDLAGNEGLCSSNRDSCFLSDVGRTLRDDDDSELGSSWAWQFTPFQKLNFSVEQVLKSLVDANVIGKGCSGVVYRADMDNGEVIAVKKLWPTTVAADNGYCNDDKCGVRDSFSAEVKTLGSIRHKNIVRFLGCAGIGTRDCSCMIICLMEAWAVFCMRGQDMPLNGNSEISKPTTFSLASSLRLTLADFGLAKLVDEGTFARSSNTIAGSYGYIAPEYGYMMKITEKSDVYSYGVVVLEVLTGKQPIDPTIPDGLHVVDG
ncbi:hypothetical protein M0R45_018658 [Rubus argutus]|uniref:non-specific serine/threonine protein kinase n=1 Tax=Rubus argutus TaxID=59490 RepID=A0AAW1X6L1_RUBAR